MIIPARQGTGQSAIGPTRGPPAHLSRGHQLPRQLNDTSGGMLCRVEPADDPDFELSADGGAVDDGQEEDVPISDADTAPQVTLFQSPFPSHRPWTSLETCSETWSAT